MSRAGEGVMSIVKIGFCGSVGHGDGDWKRMEEVRGSARH